MLNKLTLIGRCGQDARVGVTQKGVNYANVSVAASTGKDKSEWFDIVAYEKQAEWLAKATKGALIYVEGPVSINSYQAKDGNQRTTLQVTGYSIKLLQRTGENVSSDSDVPF
jgi:single stranded DNA-binding protein